MPPADHRRGVTTTVKRLVMVTLATELVVTVGLF